MTGGVISVYVCVLKRLLLHLFTHSEDGRDLSVWSECDQVRILTFSACSMGADMIRMPSGDTADSKAMMCTPFGIR